LIPSFNCSIVNGGITFVTKCLAVSSRFPVGSPVTGSFSILPPVGSKVSLLILAIFNAIVFKIALCPKAMLTGLLGAASSSSSLVGNLFSINMLFVPYYPCP
jgi:hypothetical protein